MEAIAIVYDDGLHFVASWGRVAEVSRQVRLVDEEDIAPQLIKYRFLLVLLEKDSATGGSFSKEIL